jgi:protein PhnA
MTSPTSTPQCPQCKSTLTYNDGTQWACPECAHEWPTQALTPQEDADVVLIKDAVGNILQNGDSVILVKDLKLKGSSTVVKVGTKVKSIRLVQGDHNIDCKLDGVGAIQLKSEFVKKA